MTPENRILELIWNSIPDDVSYPVNYYPSIDIEPSELYIEIEGRCFRIKVEEHEHGWA